MGRRRGPLQRHVPALALFPRTAGHDHLQTQACDTPSVPRGWTTRVDIEGSEQVFGGIVVAMALLDAAEEREFVMRSHVQLEGAYAGPLAVVHTLAVLPISLAARLPVPFEHRAAPIRQGREL